MNYFSSLGRAVAAALWLLAAALTAQAQNVGIGTAAPTQTLDVNCGCAA